MKTDLEQLLIETERRRELKKATANSLYAVLFAAFLLYISRYTAISITDDALGMFLLFCAMCNLFGLAQLIRFGALQSIGKLFLMVTNLVIVLAGFILGGAMIFFRH